MTDIWNSIELKLKEIAPDILNNLNAGAETAAIENFETLIHSKLPESFKFFYKVHNGQKSESAGLIECEELLSLERIEDEWKVWKGLLDEQNFEDDNGLYTSEPDPGIKNDWWNPLWIPITYDVCGNHYCIDLDPADEGHYGQIIRMWHDDPQRSLEAKSFTEWINKYKDRLLNGELVYSEEYFGIIDKNEIDPA